MTTYADPEWVESMLALCSMREQEAPGPRLPGVGTLWHSRSSGRRGSVVWVTGGQVGLEWRTGTLSVFKLDDFLRLYAPV